MEETIHSFLMVGQSNMAGRGDLTQDTAVTSKNCSMLRMGRWQPLQEPITPGPPGKRRLPCHQFCRTVQQGCGTDRIDSLCRWRHQYYRMAARRFVV